MKQIVKVYFLFKNKGFPFLLIFGAQNQLPITFCSDLVCNKTLRVEIQPANTRMSNF